MTVVVLFRMNGKDREIVCDDRKQRIGLVLVALQVIRDECFRQGFDFEFYGIEQIFEQYCGEVSL